MKGANEAKLDSARMGSVRSISLVIAAFAVLLLSAGCGSEDGGGGLDATDAAAIETKLSQVAERAAAGRCTGDNSALSSLSSLSDFVRGGTLGYVSESTRTDLEELLARLGDQIQSQCEQTDGSAASTTTTSTAPEADGTTTDTESTEDTTRKQTSTTTGERTPTGPRQSTTPTPPNQGGGGAVGGDAGPGVGDPPANGLPGGAPPGGGASGNGPSGNGPSGGGASGGGAPDGSGGIGPGVIGSVFSATAPGIEADGAERDSVLEAGDHAPRVNSGARR